MIASLVSQKQGNGAETRIACPLRVKGEQWLKNRLVVGFRRVFACYNV